MTLAPTCMQHTNATAQMTDTYGAGLGVGLVPDTIGRSRDAFMTEFKHVTLNTALCSHHLCVLNKNSHLHVAYVCSSGTVLRPSVGIVLGSALFVARDQSSHEIQNSIFVWPSSVNVGIVFH